MAGTVGRIFIDAVISKNEITYLCIASGIKYVDLRKANGKELWLLTFLYTHEHEIFDLGLLVGKFLTEHKK